jgi:hypothetical protein
MGRNNYRLKLVLSEIREKGWNHAMKRVVSFLLQPFSDLISRNRFLIELRYGYLPKLTGFTQNSGLVRLPQSDLVREVRKFWYSNVPGDFDLEGEKISRKEIFTYGGPNPKFTCSICQKSEWLSRVRQKNLFVSHSCPQAKECKDLCVKQGDDLWTPYQQDFNFSIGCNPNLPAPKGLYILYRRKEQFLNPCCDFWHLVFRRQLAYACQLDVIQKVGKDINWHNYDFLFFHLGPSAAKTKFTRPNIPIIAYGHDFWPIKNKIRQWKIDWLKPDFLLTPYPGPWKENFQLPPQTKIVFYPFFDSTFFARPNLGEKALDLLVIGALSYHSIYVPRVNLSNQISQLTSRYIIEFSHLAGASNVEREGSVWRKDIRSGKEIRFLNKWSEYLGSAKYVIFGRMKYPVLVSKYYETLGSGAIPIFPEVPDLKYLGVKPFEHYIPLSEVEGNNQKLAYYLDNYDKFRYIAQNAVNWYKKVSDKMIFNDFEDLIREITNYKYPKRLI